MITLVTVTNPFQPATNRTVQDVAWFDGMTLADLLTAGGVALLRHVCVIDGLVVTEELFAGYSVADGLTVIAMPNVAGSGGWKMFAEIGVMLASIAAVALLGPAGIPFLGIAGGNLLTLGTASLIGGAIALGGNILVNAFMGGGGGGGNNGNSWDPTGPKTIASGGTPIQKGYGKYLSGGSIIASYVAAEGTTSYINALVSYGWGPAVSLSDVSINGNTIDNYSAVTYMTRLGSNTQTPIPGFNNIVNGYPQDIRVVATYGNMGTGVDPGTPVVIEGTGTDTQGLEIVCQWPEGVFYSNNDGSLRSLAVSFLIQYSVSGAGVWQSPNIPRNTSDIVTYNYDGTVATYPTWVVIPTDTMYSSGIVYAHDSGSHTPGDSWTGTANIYYADPQGTISGPTTLHLSGEWQLCDPNLNQQQVIDWSGGWQVFVACSQSALYTTTSIFNLPANKYDVQITKYGSAFGDGDTINPGEANNNRTGDQLWVWSVNEIQYQDLCYPNMILNGVRALSTNQLSGSNMNITTLVEYGITVTLPEALASFGLDNPAVVAYDMLCAPFYGGNEPAANIDVPAFAAWAAYNDELVSDGFGGTIKRHVFNGVFDMTGSNLWKSVQKVAMMAQAVVVQAGSVYTVIVDMPVTVPAQVFNSANIIRDSMKDTWLSFDDRANRIEVTFADAERNYRTDEPQAVMLPADIQAGVEVKTTRVNLLGCTNRAQAWHWAYRKLQSTDLLLLTRTFDVGINAVACQVGSVIGVQDDVTQWSYGGRIQAGSTTASLVVDVPDMPYASGEGWTVTVVHPLVQRGTGTVLTVVGNLLTFSGIVPSGHIASVQNVGGNVGAVQATGSNTAMIGNASGFAAGQAVTFYDQDVMDTQPITALDGMTLTPYAPFLQAPSPDSLWVYGQSAGAFPAKLFTVTNIKKTGDFKHTIDCLEYNAAVYSDDTPIITETLGTPALNAAVNNLTLTENYTMASGVDGGQSSRINVAWTNGPNTDYVQLWVAQNRAGQALTAESLVLTVTKGTGATLVYPTGTILEVRAVGCSSLNGPSSFANAPLETITVQGTGLAPGDVPSFTGSNLSSGAALTWGAATSAANYEIRYNNDSGNNSWLTATLLYSGSALNWTDSVARMGCYLIKALSSDSVESVNVATWNYLQSTQRLNSVGFVPGQAIPVSVTSNVYDATTNSVSLTATAAGTALNRLDGTVYNMPTQSLSWVGLTPGVMVYIYTYLAPLTLAFTPSTGGNPTPDYAANSTDLAFCSAGDNYACSPLIGTLASSGGSGSGSDPGGGGGGTDPRDPYTW